MESFAYILILAFALGTLFFAVALRDEPLQAQFPRLLGLRGVAP